MAFSLNNMSLNDVLAELGESPPNSLAAALQSSLRRRQFANINGGPVETSRLRGSVAAFQPRSTGSGAAGGFNSSLINYWGGAGLSSIVETYDENAPSFFCSYTTTAGYNSGLITRHYGYLPEGGKFRMKAEGKRNNSYTKASAEVVGNRDGWLSGPIVYYGLPVWGQYWSTIEEEYEIDPEARWLVVNLMCINVVNNSNRSGGGEYRNMETKLV